MKLWATVRLENLPAILQEGLHPLGNEINLYNNAMRIAEGALEEKDYRAFLEVEIPDNELDDYLVGCIASHGDDHDILEDDLDHAIENGDQENVALLRKWLDRMEKAESGTELLDVFGYACLYQPVAPEMIKLLDPAKMLEALGSEDADALVDAVQNTEATAFKSIGPQFWVWLMMLLGQIFGPGYGIEAEPQEAPEEEEAERLERMRVAVSRKPRKKRKKSKKSPA